jgi:proteasome accessory factor C
VEKLDRIQQLHQLFATHRQPVPLRILSEKLECTPKTVRRLIENLQNYFNAPIEYLDNKGWAYVAEPGQHFQLPGLWLTASELQSLALLLHVLENFGNGLLNEELKAVTDEVHKLLKSRSIKPESLVEHIKILPLGNRSIPSDIFLHIGEALLKKRQISLQYQDFHHKTSTRTVSPQNLVYYRDNWYLDAWCHKRQEMRVFSLARIERILSDGGPPTPAVIIPQRERDDYFAGSYGIFAGKATHTARLRFRAAIAREIAMQQWHPEQKGTWDADEYVLSVPYSDERELVRDVLRYVPDVVVEGPAALKSGVTKRLKEALKHFQKR